MRKFDAKGSRRFRALISLTVLAFLYYTGGPAESALWECGFEPDGKNCLARSSKNKIDTFSKFGIPLLTGGGKYCINARWRGSKSIPPKPDNPNSDDLRWYRNQYHTDDLYVRVYVYFPPGWKAWHHLSKSLKWMSIGGSAKAGLAGHIKMQEEGGPDGNGRLRLSWAHALPPTRNYIGPFFPGEGISRGSWHYIEFHFKAQSGKDIFDFWIDTDARYSPPTFSDPKDFFVPDKGGFSAVSMNINWTGNSHPTDQAYYVDGMKTDTSPIGDTYGLLIPPPNGPLELKVE